MADLSTMSDEDLAKALKTPDKPLSKPSEMSDADLMKALGQEAPLAPPQSSGLTDVANSAGIGLVKGTIGLAGMPADVAHLFGEARDKYLTNPILKAMGSEPLDLDKPDPALALGSQNIQKHVEDVTGPLYEPKTTPGHVAQTMAEFAPGAMMGEGPAAAKLMRYAVTPGAFSEAAGHFTDNPYVKSGAALLSTLLNPRRMVTPNPITPERQAMVDTLGGEGVESLTAGQRTGNKRLRYAEATAADTPLSGSPMAEELNQAQADQFTRAALTRVGENSTSASPEVVDRAFRRIGGDFDRLSANNHVAPDRQLGNDLHQAASEYDSLVPASHRSPIVADTVRDIGDMFAQNNGVLPGEAYQALRSRLSRLSRSTKDDPQLSGALHDMTEGLDSAMERSIQASNPADAGAFGQARQQYRNMMVIEKAATSAGENTAMGQISPRALAGAVKQVYGRRNYARGQGDFADLARAGEAVMSPLPQSGTGPRQSVMHHLQLAGLLGVAGHEAGGLSGAAGGAITGLVAPALSARYTMNPMVQRYLANQLMREGAPANPMTRRLLAAQLMGQQANQTQGP